ncbi:hypothetical protein AVEN_68713-1 [Araneus ventricosus]|uniref:Uncharacterized protein n=1 Tax=Araneus ventricosus TaxID=182803 RepID=A0A4Y2V919_ARAVE|nr:hypothetical protein AVEN_68713-1 [Araneus ventricosus]
MDAEQPCSESGMDTEPSTSSHNTSAQLQGDSKTKKIKITLRSSVSKLKKKLYEERSSISFLGQLKANWLDKPYELCDISIGAYNAKRRAKKERRQQKEKSLLIRFIYTAPAPTSYSKNILHFQVNNITQKTALPAERCEETHRSVGLKENER